MLTETNKALARRYFDEYLNQGRGAAGEDLFAPTYQSHFPGNPNPLDKTAYDQITISFFSAFPDGHFTVENMIAEGDKVASRYTFSGTHLGRWTAALGTPPTGKTITISGDEIFRIVDGKIVEKWAQFDIIGALRQFGVVPPQNSKVEAPL